MASPHPSPNVELEAAKFLQKLIQDSKDEPAKLATKLYVILQHMKSSGKENSIPYQVISRAMETVVNQHGLDIETLMTSHISMAHVAQGGDSGSSSHYAGSSQASIVGKEHKVSYSGNDTSKVDMYNSTRRPVFQSTGGHEYYQNSVANRSNQSFDHESPSSMDSKSANSQSQEIGQHNSKDSKKLVAKRKRDASMSFEHNIDSFQQSDSGKANLSNPPVVSARGFERAANINMPTASVQSEVSSAHISTFHQGNSPSPMNEGFSSKVGWNQNRAGLPLEKSHNARFPGNSVNDNTLAENSLQHSSVSPLGSNFFGKVPGGLSRTSCSQAVSEIGFSQATAFEHHKNYLSKSCVDQTMEMHSLSVSRDDLHSPSTVSKTQERERERVTSSIFSETNQGMRKSSCQDVMLGGAPGPRDLGKTVSLNSAPPDGLFREQQLKQLRAQCLVFLAFRNGLVPKKLHLDVALGGFPKDGGSSDGSKDLIDQKGKGQSSNEPVVNSGTMIGLGRVSNSNETERILSGAPSSLRLQDMPSFSGQDEKMMMAGGKIFLPRNVFAVADERVGHPSIKQMDLGKHNQEYSDSEPLIATTLQHGQYFGSIGALAMNNTSSEDGNGHQPTGKFDQMGMHNPVHVESIYWSGMGNRNEDLSKAASLWNQIGHSERKDDSNCHFQNNDVPERDDEEKASVDSLQPGRYTMSEKWVVDFQRKLFLNRRNLLLKKQKTKQRISIRFEKLKEAVSSSEDLSTKTKSVIELKKLQLLDLQHRLRSEFLIDYFKPIFSEMDRLMSFKKYKHPRRAKQLERFEQKMKEERQKRARDRQKEFFSDIEVHKERLDDASKMKKERWKGFNRYAKEFHKRKERIHREKIDRIQREKINLLKINDVEGYLRMVQDAKSDRVKQLLKETEKYLQKLGSKLQEAKAVACRFESESDEPRSAPLIEKNDPVVENEDESDQAKHYLESNEKYYMMAHSVKEIIAEQPACLIGGKLREYQMNGLRWLVSLYNNHLNGILADEMGLGKTVQVISLICYLMETKNDRGPFLVVVPSSVLPGWESEINFWAPKVHKVVYSGPPDERRRLFKEQIVHQKFNVLLTTYEYLMNKHDRPKLSKIHWHYIIIDEGHRIKNASCKLNADLKHYQSSHRLLLTGTPLQNNLEELWALLNFLLPNIFNSSEDFSQWFNKPFESNGDTCADEALLSEEENLLIINRLHQVLRPFVLRRLKHKVENELPEKIERLIRCEASAYQKLLMKRVEDNLGSIGNSKARSVHNTVMELRNICNHPYLSQLHSDEVDNMTPTHFLPNIVRLCGKLEMLDRILPKLKSTDHRVLFFSTMTRLLDIMEDYLTWKQYRYLRLDGHTSGGDRGALIEMFNQPNSPFFIFLLSIRAGGVGVNLQAADTVIIFDTDWNPQVDLQAQARAHRIGQKRDVLVLRFETVQTVEEQVRASAEHKLGVANQSITAGFFDNNTSAEDRREYLEALLRECKKEEASPVLDDDALNDLIARSESEIDIFESVDKERREIEMGYWRELLKDKGVKYSDAIPLPSRLVTEDDLKAFCERMKLYDVPKTVNVPTIGMKRKGQYVAGLDTKQYGRGKRAREVRSYEEQWTEEEFERMCQANSPGSPSFKDEPREKTLAYESCNDLQPSPAPTQHEIPPCTEEAPPPKRGRGRPRRVMSENSPIRSTTALTPGKIDSHLNRSSNTLNIGNVAPQSCSSVVSPQQTTLVYPSVVSDVSTSLQVTPRGRGRKVNDAATTSRRRGRKSGPLPDHDSMPVPDSNRMNEIASTTSVSTLENKDPGPDATVVLETGAPLEGDCLLASNLSGSSAINPHVQNLDANKVPVENKNSSRRRGRKPTTVSTAITDASVGALNVSQALSNEPQQNLSTILGSKNDSKGSAGYVSDSNISEVIGVKGDTVSEVSSSQLKGNLSEPHLMKKQSRKAASELEGQRRRGRKPVSASSTIDTPTSQEIKLNLLTNKSGDPSVCKVTSLRSKHESDPSMPSAIQDSHMSASFNAQESKRKEHIATPTYGRMPTADVTDVARLMKEIFSENNTLKNRSDDSPKFEGRNIILTRAVNKVTTELPIGHASEDTTSITTRPCADDCGASEGQTETNAPLGFEMDDGPPGFSSLNKKDVEPTVQISSSFVQQITTDVSLDVGSSFDRKSLSLLHNADDRSELGNHSEAFEGSGADDSKFTDLVPDSMLDTASEPSSAIKESDHEVYLQSSVEESRTHCSENLNDSTRSSFSNFGERSASTISVSAVSDVDNVNFPEHTNLHFEEEKSARSISDDTHTELNEKEKSARSTAVDAKAEFNEEEDSANFIDVDANAEEDSVVRTASAITNEDVAKTTSCAPSNEKSNANLLANSGALADQLQTPPATTECNINVAMPCLVHPTTSAPIITPFEDSFVNVQGKGNEGQTIFRSNSGVKHTEDCDVHHESPLGLNSDDDISCSKNLESKVHESAERDGIGEKTVSSADEILQFSAVRTLETATVSQRTLRENVFNKNSVECHVFSSEDTNADCDTCPAEANVAKASAISLQDSDVVASDFVFDDNAKTALTEILDDGIPLVEESGYPNKTPTVRNINEIQEQPCKLDRSDEKHDGLLPSFAENKTDEAHRDTELNCASASSEYEDIKATESSDGKCVLHNVSDSFSPSSKTGHVEGLLTGGENIHARESNPADDVIIHSSGSEEHKVENYSADSELDHHQNKRSTVAAETKPVSDLYNNSPTQQSKHDSPPMAEISPSLSIASGSDGFGETDKKEDANLIRAETLNQSSSDGGVVEAMREGSSEELNQSSSGAGINLELPDGSDRISEGCENADERGSVEIPLHECAEQHAPPACSDVSTSLLLPSCLEEQQQEMTNQAASETELANQEVEIEAEKCGTDERESGEAGERSGDLNSNQCVQIESETRRSDAGEDGEAADEQPSGCAGREEKINALFEDDA